MKLASSPASIRLGRRRCILHTPVRLRSRLRSLRTRSVWTHTAQTPPATACSCSCPSLLVSAYLPLSCDSVSHVTIDQRPLLLLDDDGMKPGAAVSWTGSSVAFSWEQEPGVSKQGAVEANKREARAALGTEADSKRTTLASTRKETPAETTAQQHQLRVPPPPGGPGAPAVSPSGRSRPRSSGVRSGDDPFLAAYLACTEGGSNGGQKLLGWARLGLGLGYGFGFSCKSSCEAVEENIVRMAKFPPKFTRND